MKFSKKIYLITLFPIVLLLLGAFTSGYFVDKSNEASQKYIIDYVERQSKLNEIFVNLGYGRGIHYFKNYILRFNDDDRINSKKYFLVSKNLVKEYLNFASLSQEELDVLKNVSNTIDAHIERLDQIEVMIQKKFSLAQIDDAVIYDDKPIIESLEMVQKYFEHKRASELFQLKQSQRTAFFVLIFVFVIAFIVSIVLSQNFARGIIDSIKKLMKISENISLGKYSKNTTELENLSDDELKILANQMVQMSEELNITFNKLKLSNEDLTNFAFIASHDLQEPIKKISNYVDLIGLELGNTVSEDVSLYVQEVKDSTARMINLIRTLLNYSAINESLTEFKSVDLNETLKICKMNLDVQIQESNAKISYLDLPQVFGDKELLISLFQNLISNSIKYQNKNEDPVIEIKFNKEVNGKWKISFQDNAMGFDMKYIKTVLRPFGRLHAKSEYPGIGIGLPLCKKIVQLHGSRLIIDSAENRGTNFSFELNAN